MVQAVRELDRYSKSEIEECSELLQYIYVNDDECFVRVLNKTTGKNKVYPTKSLKDPMKLRQVINSFGREDVLFSLNPFRSMDRATRVIYSVSMQFQLMLIIKRLMSLKI